MNRSPFPLDRPLARRVARVAATLASAVVACAAWSHGGSAGDIVIGHPYASPTLAGTTTGAAYLLKLENTGERADRLVGATTPAAASVEIHTMTVDAQGVMRMREVDALVLAPKQSMRMQPGQGTHLMLVGVHAPLKEGTSFPMTLRFERAGNVDVKVVVQVHRPDAATSGAHAMH